MSTAHLTPALLDLMEHEKAIEQGLAGVGYHLLVIRDDRKYRAAGYSSFETYCRERWGFGRNYANKQIAAAKTVTAIEEVGTKVPTLPTIEAQVRPLAPIAKEDPAEAAAIWNEAVGNAGGEQPTAAEVAEVIQKRKPKPVPKPPSKADSTAKPHPATYSNAVLSLFRELLDVHHDGIGRVVVDPFAGTGRIHELSPRWYTVGVELEPEWANLHKQTILGDSRELALVVGRSGGIYQADAIVTSPAYGNRLADSYNAYDPEARRSYAIDLGRPLTEHNGAGMHFATDGAYEDLHETVWRQAVALLRPSGLFLLNCKDFQRDGQPIGVTGWHVRCLISLGLRVLDLRTLPAAGLPFTTAKPFSEVVIVLERPE